MAVIEINAREIAQCLCSALIECCPNEPIAIVDGTQPPRAWTVEVNPTDEEISIKAYGATVSSWPQLLGDFTVPYPPGPKILMLDEDYCTKVARAAEQAVAAIEVARGVA